MRIPLAHRATQAWTDLPLRRKGLVVVSIPCAVLLTFAGFFFLLDRAQRRAQDSVAHAYDVKLQVERTHMLMLNAENSVRNFLLTQRADVLEPFVEAQALLPPALEQLEALVDADPLQADRIALVRSLTTDRLKALAALSQAPPLAPGERGRFGDRILTTGRAVLTSLRHELDLMATREEALLTAQVADARRLGLRAQVFVPAGVATGLVAGLMAVLLFTSGVATRVQRLMQNVGDFVDGRPYSHLAPARDEIGQLSRGLDRAAYLLQERANDLTSARDEARQANRAKSDFLSRMSHELRTPLNSVIGFGQLLELADMDQRDREAAEHIVRAGRHLLGLINEVLDISRIEAGRLDMSPEPVSLEEVVQEAVELVRPMARQHGVKLDLPGTDPALHARADRQRLKQVALNLLSNAVKYNRDDGRVRIWADQTAGGVRLYVADTGAGIAPDKRARLFTPFDRLGAEQTAVEGTGLGLALSRRLVEAMGGRIDLTSEPGVGSTFWVDLPRAATPDACVNTGDAREAAVAVAGAPDRTVLYVEDNLANLRLVERLVALRPSVRLLVAMQGGLGLELAREHRPDLMLLDLHLPDDHGTRILRQLRADPATRDMPVVVVSADATPGQIARAQQAGADHYLTKPIDVHRFLAILDEHLAADRSAA